MARRRPKHPPEIVAPVEYVETPAQNAGTVVQVVREPGKITQRRRYRDHILDVMLRRGQITQRQRDAGIALFEAWCMTQTTPHSEIKVDKSPDHSLTAIMQIERMDAYAQLSKRVPRELSRIVEHVVLRGLPLAAMARGGRSHARLREKLHRALDMLIGG